MYPAPYVIASVLGLNIVFAYWIECVRKPRMVSLVPEARMGLTLGTVVALKLTSLTQI